jgi:hypothetical protein
VFSSAYINSRVLEDLAADYRLEGRPLPLVAMVYGVSSRATCLRLGYGSVVVRFWTGV